MAQSKNRGDRPQTPTSDASERQTGHKDSNNIGDPSDAPPAAPLSSRPQRIRTLTKKAAAALEEQSTPIRKASSTSTPLSSQRSAAQHRPAPQIPPRTQQEPATPLPPARRGPSASSAETHLKSAGTAGQAMAVDNVSSGDGNTPGSPTSDPPPPAAAQDDTRDRDSRSTAIGLPGENEVQQASTTRRNDSPDIQLSDAPPPKKRSKTNKAPAAKEPAAMEIEEPRKRGKRAKKSAEQKAEARARLAEGDAQVADAMETLWSAVEEAIQTAAETCGKTEAFFMLKLGLKGRELATKRAPNAKNAYVSVGVKGLNENVPDGEARWDMVSFTAVFGEDYAKLKKQDKQGYIDKLTATREEKRAPSIRKTNRATLDEANRLYVRTGQQTLILSTKTRHDSYVRPQYHIMPQAEGFVDAFLKMDMATLLHHLEGWAVDGTDGVVKSARTDQEDKKRRIVAHILKDLRDLTGKRNATMKYTNFDQHVMERYKVELVGWPLPGFKNPSKMNKHELATVLGTLTSDPPSLFFEKISTARVKELLEKHRKEAETDKEDDVPDSHAGQKRRRQDESENWSDDGHGKDSSEDEEGGE